MHLMVQERPTLGQAPTQSEVLKRVRCVCIPEDFHEDTGDIRKRISVSKIDQSVGPNHFVDRRPRLLIDVRVERHGEEKGF